jgi:hypothetical protein
MKAIQTTDLAQHRAKQEEEKLLKEKVAYMETYLQGKDKVGFKPPQKK